MNALIEDSTVELGQITTHDGINLSLRWDRVESPVAHVVIAHGFAEYTRRQRHLAQALVKAGMSVLRYDMRGHGHSGGRRGHVERFDDYVDDLLEVVDVARSESLPLFVMGHSQGGLIT
ncbi:MAG: lysophospholipase, partial [Myxococcales bacterium]|nr:lysophospholipase [Myxococcales bacterium]